MFCRQCGKQIDADDKFCEGCGKELSTTPKRPQERKEKAKKITSSELQSRVVTCPNCKYSQRISLDDMTKAGVRLKCSKCNKKFVFDFLDSIPSPSRCKETINATKSDLQNISIRVTSQLSIIFFSTSSSRCHNSFFATTCLYTVFLAAKQLHLKCHLNIVPTLYTPSDCGESLRKLQYHEGDFSFILW